VKYEKSLIFSAKVRNLELIWEDNRVTVENRILSNNLVTLANDIETFVKSLYLKFLNGFWIEDRLEIHGAWVDIFINSDVANLDGMETKVEQVRKLLKLAIDVYRSGSEQYLNSDGEAHQENVNNDPIVRPIVNSLSHLMNRTKSAIEFDLQEVNTEIVQPSTHDQIRLLPPINFNAEIVDVGMVDFFKEKNNSVTLTRLRNSPSEIILSVVNEKYRRLILFAQYKQREIEVKYHPTESKNPHDKKTGKLISVRILKITQPDLKLT
jgi:hypothetical protein